MSDEVRKLLGFFVGTVLVIGALVLLVPRWLGSASGPENEIITQLKLAERDGIEQSVPGCAGVLRSNRLQYQRISVTADPDGTEAMVNATLDLDGSFGETMVSSLGLERVAFHKVGSTWEPVNGFAPRLSQIVSALEKRRRSLENGSLEGPDDGGAVSPEVQQLLSIQQRRYRASAWYIRSEREEVAVTEDYRLQGTLPERPVDDKASVRLTLTPRNGGEFFFPHGLL